MKSNRRLSVKCIALLLCAALLVPALPFGFAEEKTAPDDLNIATLSNLLYYPDSLAGDKGEAYYTYTEGEGVNGRDLDAILDAAFASLKHQAERGGLNCVVICGDLTLGGEYEGAAAIAKKLRLFAFESGLRVFVLNGDRDINNPAASDFTTNLKRPARNVTPAEFLDLFGDLGYNAAYHVYKPLGSGTQGSLSYSVKLDEGYRLIMADCCRYTADCTAAHTDACEKSSGFSEAQLQWVLDEAADAKKNGETPLLFTHAGIVPVNELQEKLLPDTLVEDYYKAEDKIADAGVLCSFCGALGASDVNSYVSDGGSPVCSVAASSVTQFPFAYRITQFVFDADGSADISFNSHDCDDTVSVRASGGNDYPTPYRSIGFAKQFGGQADAEKYLNMLARKKLGELCADIIAAGGVVGYLEKTFDVDVSDAVVSAVGTGLRLGPVTVLSAANVMSYIEDLDARLMEAYVYHPSNLYGVVATAVKGIVSVPVSDVPCSRYLTTYGFGSRERGGNLGDLLLDAIATFTPGNEDIFGDLFMKDALKVCRTPEFAGRLVEALRTYVVDGILVDEILANTEFRISSLFSSGVISESDSVQMFFSVVLAILASKLLSAQTGNEAWNALSGLLTDGSAVSVGSVISLMLDAGESGTGRSVEEFLDTVFARLFGDEQKEAIAYQIYTLLNSLCYDSSADTGEPYRYSGAAAVPADESNMRIPSMVQMAVNGNNSFTVTWFTKYSVTGTDVEIVKEGGAFTGKPTVSDMIAADTKNETFRGFGFDCGNYGFMTYEKDVVRHVVTVRNLVADTAFRFRIGDAAKGFWKECSFTAGSKNGNAFTFLHFSDSDGVTGDAYAAAAADLSTAADALSPSFIVHSGNLVRYPWNDAQWAWMLDENADVFSHVPLMYASGANDADGYYSVQKHLTYSRTPTQFAEDGVYYSFDYGSAHFTVLNTNALLADGKLSAKQENWLKDDLSGTDAAWRILVLYAPVFCVENSNLKLEAQLKEIVSPYHVDLVLEGGAGGYVRSDLLKNGEPTDVYTVDTEQYNGQNYSVYEANDAYIVSSAGPFGGNTPELAIRNTYTAVAQRMPASVFNAVTVDGDTLYVSAYTVQDGELNRIDSYGLRKDSVTFLQGDTDLDGEVTSADARLALRIAVGLDDVTPITKAAADMDGDIYVSPSDARLILRTSVGLEKEPEQVRLFRYEIAKYKNA